MLLEWMNVSYSLAISGPFCSHNLRSCTPALLLFLLRGSSRVRLIMPTFLCGTTSRLTLLTMLQRFPPFPPFHNTSVSLSKNLKITRLHFLFNEWMRVSAFLDSFTGMQQKDHRLCDPSWNRGLRQFWSVFIGGNWNWRDESSIDKS